VPHVHRHGAGVAGLAKHHDTHTALPDNPGDHAERQPFRLQHGPLLDMHLDIADDICRVIGRGRDVIDVVAIGPDRVGERDAAPVRERERRAVEHTGAGRRSGKRGAKARSLFVAERQHVDAERQIGVAPRKLAHREDAGNPSYLPASITVSICEPISRRFFRSGRQCPRTVPSASSVTVIPASRIQEPIRSAAFRCSGVR
jgi:hypothetical protein